MLENFQSTAVFQGSYPLLEMSGLLGISKNELNILLRNNSHIARYRGNDETPLYSALDILAVHLYLTVAADQKRPPTRHLLSVMAIFACEELLSEFETRPPPDSSLEIEERLNENSTLISMHIGHYSKAVSYTHLTLPTKRIV